MGSQSDTTEPLHFHSLGAYSGAGTLYAAPPSPHDLPEVGTGSSFSS